MTVLPALFLPQNLDIIKSLILLYTVIGHDDLTFKLNPLVKNELNSKPPKPFFVFGRHANPGKA